MSSFRVIYEKNKRTEARKDINSFEKALEYYIDLCKMHKDPNDSVILSVVTIEDKVRLYKNIYAQHIRYREVSEDILRERERRVNRAKFLSEVQIAYALNKLIRKGVKAAWIQEFKKE